MSILSKGVIRNSLLDYLDSAVPYVVFFSPHFYSTIVLAYAQSWQAWLQGVISSRWRPLWHRPDQHHRHLLLRLQGECLVLMLDRLWVGVEDGYDGGLGSRLDGAWDDDLGGG